MRKNSDKNMTVFGRNLRALRRRNNLSQEKFAIALGITRDTVSYYECKAKNPTVDFVQKVADYFAIGTDELLLNAPETRIKPGPKSKIEAKVEAIKKLPKHEQKAVFTLIDSLVSKHVVTAK